MEQRIINAIALALDKLFPDYPVLDKVSDQNVGRPAFFISCIESVIQERIKDAGFFVRYTFDLMFEPDAFNVEALCREVQSELTFLLRRIPDPESDYAFRPYYVHFEMQSGILHSIFNIREAFMPVKEDLPKVVRHKANSEIKEIE